LRLLIVQRSTSGFCVGFRITLYKSIPVVPCGACTYGKMATGVAIGIYAAFVDAWVLAFVVDASLAIGTMAVVGTFSLETGSERIPRISVRTSTYRAFVVRTVETWFAMGIASTRIGLTKISWFERSTPDERISGHVSRARTNRGETSELAVGTGSTSSLARTLTNTVETCWSRAGAIDVSVTLGLAGRIGISEIVLGTLAHSSVVADGLAFGVFAALSQTRILTFEFYAGLNWTTFGVAFALVSASCQWRTVVSRYTRTCGHLVSYLAMCVGSTRTRVAKFLRIKSSAGLNRISCVSSWTSTNRDPPSCFTIGVHSTSSYTRIYTFSVSTGQLASTFCVVQALFPLAIGQRVSRVPSET